MTKDWPSVSLSQVLARSKERIEIQSQQRYKQITVRLWGKGAVLRDEVYGSNIKSKTRFVARGGQFILSRIDARNGAIGVVPDQLDGAVVTNDFPVFEIDTSLAFPDYLRWLSRTQAFIDLCASVSDGTTNRVRLNIDRFLGTLIPLPDLDEQRRIVARVEAIVGRIEEARRLRESASGEAERLLRSVRNILFDSEHRNRWPSFTLGEIADICAGVTLGRRLEGPTITVPYLRVANVQDGYLDLEEVKEIEIQPHEMEKWRLEPGDIVLTEGGDWDKLGRGTVWQGEIDDCIHQNHIFRVRVDLSEYNPYYLSALISSPYGKEYFQLSAKRTTNLASINQRQLKAFAVFRPPMPEQDRIVTHLRELREWVGQLECLQTETAPQFDTLLAAVLDKAFRGEL